MSLNSVNTNMGAMVALQSLENTQSQLAVTQKQISTGYRVADSTDDGAAYAIAQGIRSTVGALTSANQQLGSVQGLLSTTNKALTDISNMMASMRDVLVNLSSESVTGDEQTNYENTYKSMLANLKSFITDSNYSGKTLIGNIAPTGGSTSGFGTVNIAINESGGTYALASHDYSAIYASLAAVTTSFTGTGTAAAIVTDITTGDMFISKQNTVGNDLNTIGSAINYVNNQTTYNSDKIDALNSGLGSLVDADLAKESAQLTALQIRQQLGTQALSLANQAPQSLLSLFK
jgi:flagellin